jgi:hypothetical protein
MIDLTDKVELKDPRKPIGFYRILAAGRGLPSQQQRNYTNGNMGSHFFGSFK